MKHLTIVVIALFASIASKQSFGWQVISEKDNITDTTDHYVVGDLTAPDKKLTFPYNSTKSNIFIACVNGNLVPVLHFNSGIQFEGKLDLGGDGSTLTTALTLRSRWDNDVYTIDAKQKVDFDNTTNVFFIHPATTLKRIKKHNKVIIEFKASIGGRTTFTYDLQGATKAITQLDNLCG